MKLLRKIFFPIVPFYYLISWLRNKLYDLNILKSNTYNIPVVCVGNLSVGGTGKTPMIEYLIRMLRRDHLVATLSRGYKRITRGFILANTNSSVEELGDEPYQFKNKFSDILVAVDANRQNGIEKLLALKKPPEIILLDDGFQHRKVNAGLYILLTTYNNLYINDFVLPTGDLREPCSGAKRADIIMVTKCPIRMNNEHKSGIIRKLNPKANQKVFFSNIKYDDKVFNDQESFELDTLINKDFTFVTGIANPKPIVNYLNSKGLKFEHLNYNDHHNFTRKDIFSLKKKNLILTTEKDYMRLKDKLVTTRIFYLPIKSEIDKKEEFNNLVKEFLLKF